MTKEKISYAVFSLRVPQELYGEIKKAAEENERSVNSEVLFRVKNYLKSGSANGG